MPRSESETGRDEARHGAARRDAERQGQEAEREGRRERAPPRDVVLGDAG